jgi:hypothetical protein
MNEGLSDHHCHHHHHHHRHDHHHHQHHHKGYNVRYRLIMHTHILLAAVTCYTCYQSIMQAAHSIDWKCMLTLLMIDTVTAHMMYSLHLWTCYPLIMHILHDIDRPIMVTYMTSITSVCKRLRMLTWYRSILYVHDIDRCYMLYMLTIHNASCTLNRWNMHADTANDRYCYSSYNIYSTSTNMLSIDNAYTTWYRSIMVTSMTSITYACMLSC